VEASVQLTGQALAKCGLDVFAFRPDKRYQLLAYLAHHGDWVSRERLSFLFWSDVPPDAARHNLRQLLSRTRVLEFSVGLEVEIPRLRWAVETDVAAFARALAGGRWQEALEAYRGPLLAGLEGEDVGEFAAWLELERERLHGQWHMAVLRRAEGLEGDGLHLEAAELLKPLVDGNELDEVALGAYVGALFRAGGRDQALRAYEGFVGRLREELRLEPTAELERLARALRSGDGLDAPFDSARQRDTAVSDSFAPTLSAWITSFVGRDLELTEIARLLARHDCRLLTLTGPGGIGKTRLALEALRQIGPAHPDGAFFVSLDALASSALIPSSLADGLGRGLAAPLDQVARFIGQKRLLVVLDNFEHLLDGAHYALELVRACPGLSLLVTSRERLGLEAEWLLPIEGLSYPDKAGVGPTESLYFDAVQLFLERARRVRPGFAPNRDDLPHLLEICHLLEGSPLGLELAAVWVRLLPLSEIAREIGADLDFLSVTQPDRERRHHSLRAVFDQSWAQLSPAEQGALVRLSVLVGGFRAEAARRVADVPLPVLAALADKSLLRLNPNGRYDRLVLLYQYAREKLAARPDEEAEVEERHGRYFLDLLSRRGDEILGPNGKAALGALDEDLENIRAAWRWAVKKVRVEELRQVVVQAAIYHDRRARFQEGLGAFAAVTACLGEAEPAHRLTLGDALVRQGWFAMRLGRYAEAHELAERGFTLLPAGSPSAMHGLNALATIAEHTGAYLEAERRFKQAIGLAKRHGLPARQADLLAHLASVGVALGRHEEAQQHIEEAMSLYRRARYQIGTVFGLIAQGHVALRTAQLEKAEASFGQGLALATDLGVHQCVPSHLHGLAEVAFERAAWEEAQRLGEEGLARARAGGDWTMEVAGLNLLARTSAAIGADQAALDHLGRSLSLAWSAREMPRLLEGLVYLAELRVKRGQVDHAMPLLEAALHHPATEHRLKLVASSLLEQIRGRVAQPTERAARDRALRLEALMDEVLAELDSAY
jgi:predicted ATPase/DNA-binding SARP family transcriptional activator/Tfp pilus assembly protein PilF